MSDSVTQTLEGVPLPEIKVISPSVESFGASNQGGRDANEDAFFTTSQGFFPADLQFGEYEKLAEQEGKAKASAKYLSDLLSGLELKDEHGEVVETLRVSEEDVLNLQQNMQALIGQGRLGGLEIVADGMGGHGSGDLASSVAVVVLADSIIRSLQSGDTLNPEMLKKGILKANAVIAELNKGEYGTGRMGTTLTAVLFSPDGKQAYLGSVGDSRAYHLDLPAGNVNQLSIDQSFVWRYQMEDFENVQKPSDFFTHQQRQVLSRAIGVDGKLDVEINSINLSPGDILLLCSDGV